MLDDIKAIKRVKVKTPGFHDEEFKIDQSSYQSVDTLVIFNDTDCITKKKKKLDQLNKIADVVDWCCASNRTTYQHKHGFYKPFKLCRKGNTNDSKWK